ncbi:hypothetical protein OAT67_06465 [Bacteriovoracaceae bacterium]|nr:hypothetical protein [Bacteriovoracaceae bacterium]
MINPSIAVALSIILTAGPMFFCYLFGHKIFLVAAKSFKYRKNNQIVSMIENISCRLGIKTPEVYFSPFLSTNFYVASSALGDCIILGGRIEYKLSASEKYNALEAALMGIKNKKAARITFISCLNMFYEIPSWFFRKVLKLPSLAIIYRTALFSVFMVKDFLIERYSIIEIDAFQKSSQQYAYYFKILPYKMKHGYFFEPMLRDLALVTPPKAGIQDHMLGNLSGLNSIYIKNLLSNK